VIPAGSRVRTRSTRSGAIAIASSPGREAIIRFLTAKWDRELDYALRKNLWAFTEDRIAVRFQYESRDASGQWWRSYGNELWEFEAAAGTGGSRGWPGNLMTLLARSRVYLWHSFPAGQRRT
jgi:nuclear transport factor 2 (NTF2) superfamily protein